MNILFWNIRGFGDRAKRRIVAKLCRANRVDIFCLEETKLCNASLRTLGELSGNSQFEFAVKDSVGASGGILIGIRVSDFDL